jgi:hypothetical protein
VGGFSHCGNLRTRWKQTVSSLELVSYAQNQVMLGYYVAKVSGMLYTPHLTPHTFPHSKKTATAAALAGLQIMDDAADLHDLHPTPHPNTLSTHREASKSR